MTGLSAWNAKKMALSSLEFQQRPKSDAMEIVVRRKDFAWWPIEFVQKKYVI